MFQHLTFKGVLNYIEIVKIFVSMTFNVKKCGKHWKATIVGGFVQK